MPSLMQIVKSCLRAFSRSSLAILKLTLTLIAISIEINKVQVKASANSNRYDGDPTSINLYNSNLNSLGSSSLSRNSLSGTNNKMKAASSENGVILKQPQEIEVQLILMNEGATCDRYNKICKKDSLMSEPEREIYLKKEKFCGARKQFGNRMEISHNSQYESADSICGVFSARCKKNELKFIQGDCSSLSLCQKKKNFHLLTHKLTKDNKIYIPNCDPVTGLFAEKQCHHGIGYCWCAFPDNKKVDNTVTRLGEELDCIEKIRQLNKNKIGLGV